MNIPLNYWIKATPSGGMPVGFVTMFEQNSAPDDWMPADGRSLSAHQYLPLFQVIGDSYCSRTLPRKTLWARFLRWANITDQRDPNPLYREGYFTIPDLRGHTAHGRPH